MTATPLRIAFLDDRPENQATVINGLRGVVPKGWEIIACPLQPKVTDYPLWIHNNNVVVLLVDQLLNEQGPKGGKPVSYKGHNVVAAIRKQIPEFPLVVATRATEDEDLSAHFGDADGIVSKSDLLKEPKQYIQRYVRLGKKFVATFEAELARLSELSQQAASGKLNKGDKKELEAIQAKLNLEASVEAPLDDALDKWESKLDALDELTSEASKAVARLKKK